MAEDKLVIMQSKILRSFLLAFGVKPSPEGLWEALPPDAREVIKIAYEQAHTVAPTIATVGENLPKLVAMIGDTHRIQQENNIMLRALCAELNISPVLMHNERIRVEALAIEDASDGARDEN